MLKYETVAAIGDIIRAYDFKPMVESEDIFVEGPIVDINDNGGYKAFVIRCTKDTSSMGRGGEYIYVPMETSFMEYDGRIMNLSA